MTTVTRETLYEQVWSRPMTKVAEEYGLTSAGLKKTCKRYDIPTPPRGYWQQLAHGKAVQQVPLPRAPSAGNAITITGDTRPRFREATNDGETARAFSTAIDAMLSDITESPILASTRRAAQKARPDFQGFINIGGRGLLGLRIAPLQVERAMRIASALIAISEAGGGGVVIVDTGIALKINGANIAFRIAEEGHAEPHAPTPEEARRAKDNARWGGSPTPWPKYDYSPSGRLSVAIDANPYSRIRRKYADGKKQKLEDLFAKILDGFADHAAYMVEQKRLNTERARAHADAEARRQGRQAYEAREKRRLEMIDAIHTQLVSRQKFLAVLAHVEKGPDHSGSMAIWIRNRVRMIDAVLSADFIGLSARHAKISFAGKDDQTEDCYSYFEPFALQFWAIDEARGVATSMSGQDWLEAQPLESPATPA